MRIERSDEQIEYLNSLPARYGEALTKYAFRFFGYRPDMYQLAEDAVQETFFKAIVHVEELMAHPNPLGWLLVTLRHQLLDLARSQSSSQEVLMADVTASAQVAQKLTADALMHWEQQPRLTELHAASLAVLSADEFSTYTDHFLVGLTINETAAAQRVSEDAIRGRVGRIRKKLKKYFSMLCCFALFLRY